ncbi:haloacid dehalogenase-like hydrolase [Micromonospora sp. NPDC048170]|uniref:HAD family hydrolase n=1 Tax=Micromonospora sp. NPDC048170 TaxID=3154819 RepID=UPI0033C9D0CB
MTRDAHTPLLVLWDIDQTLIEGGTVTHRAYAAAFHTATGRRLEQPWRFDGRTELAAATEVLRAHGLDPDGGLLETFLELIVAELHRRADELAATGHVLPGVVDALAAVGAVAGVHQSVLTGNLYPLALLKLRLFGLDGHFDTRIGAYGGDAWERRDLPQYAFGRAEQHLGRRLGGSDTVIIGDTCRDVDAAHAVGARAVAVATGTTSAARLTAAGADVVLPDLADTTAVLRAVTSRDPAIPHDEAERAPGRGGVVHAETQPA